MITESTEADSLRQLADQKEKEWKHIQDLRAQTLESTIKHKDALIVEERAKFFKLKEDFKYNLQLLNDRDQELEKYDCSFKELRRELSQQSAEVSELKIEIADLHDRLGREREAVEEVQRKYQQRLREKQTEIEQYRIAKDDDVRKERDEIETVKRKLERQLKELEGELEVQRRELTFDFDEAMKRREHEFQIKRDEMSNEILAAEIKAKMLEKEVEMLTKAHQDTCGEFTHVEENHRHLEKQLKEKTWELNDVTAMKEARIRELERDLEKMDLTMKRTQADFERKHQNLDKHCRERDMAANAIRESCDEADRKFQKSLHDLQEQLNTKEIEMRNIECTQQEMLADKDHIILKLQEELNGVKSDWDRHIAELSKSTVLKDVQLQSLTVEIDKFKSELEQKKMDIDRYKKEFGHAIERQAQLEKSKAQLDLDWSRRFDDVERVQYDKMEDFIQKLTNSRDEALSDLRKKEADLSHQRKLSQVLLRDRNAALSTLKHHGFDVERSIQLESNDVIAAVTSRDMENLREQNEKLKAVIGLMRDEMEMLGNAHQSPGRRRTPAKEAVTVLLDRDSDYVKNLEREVQELRSRARITDIETRSMDSKQEAAAVIVPEVGDNPLILAHIQSLNDTIGSLRREKVEYAAQLKKHQARIMHLETLNDQLAKESRQKQLEVDELQYELGAQVRRHETEASSLRHRLQEMELELAQSRKEADEYYKGTLARNLEATSLGNEVSSLKLKLAQKQPGIAFGGQELLIHQLQEQIAHLHHQHGTDTAPNDASDPAGQRTKLRQAALYIKQLAKEKQQLIEVSNRMRAELTRAGLKISSSPAKSHIKSFPPSQKVLTEPVTAVSATPRQSAVSEVVRSKLGQLEKLQYNLTKQELSFAQTHKPTVRYADMSSSAPSDTLSGSGPRDNLGFTASTLGTSTQRTSSPERDEHQALLMSMSSVGGESLQELWKMVDEGPSELLTTRLDTQTKGVESGQPLPDPAAWLVRGLPARPSVKSAGKPAAGKPALSERAAGKVARQKSRRTNAKIRNYNVKD